MPKDVKKSQSGAVKLGWVKNTEQLIDYLALVLLERNGIMKDLASSELVEHTEDVIRTTFKRLGLLPCGARITNNIQE